MTTKNATARWLLFPLAAIGSCGATGIAGRSVQNWYVDLLGQQRVDVTFPLDAQDAVRYFIEAFVFVVAGAAVAPRGRSIVAGLLFASGAALAWYVLGEWGWDFPEHSPRGYQRSYLPLGGTWAGGLCALAVLSLPSVRRALTMVGADGRGMEAAAAPPHL